VSIVFGAITVPATAGCRVAITRSVPPTIGEPVTCTTSLGVTRIRMVADTFPTCAVHGAAPSTRTLSLPATNRRPFSVTGSRGVTFARKVMRCA